MTRIGTLLGAFAMVVTLMPTRGEAQRADRLQRQQQQQRQLEADDQTPLARQFQLRLAEVVRRRLNLSDSQMQHLGQVNGRYERQRMQLLRQERQTRQELRRQMTAGDSANQSRVSDLLDQAMRIQRQRLDLTEREQRDLAQFMTPMQRAMYFGIQDEVRRRMEEMRQQGRAGPAPGRPGALRVRPRPPQP